MYFIGIDGGGSRSRLAAVDMDLNLIGEATGGSTNIASEEFETVFGNLKTLLEGFNTTTGTKPEGCAGICIGSAGITVKKNAELIIKAFRDIGFECKVKAMTDAELVLVSETKGDAGVAIISGTGSIGVALDNHGQFFRAGGWGHIIDDGGSGYRISMDAIKYALMDFDGRGEKTLLTEKLMEFFGIDSIAKVLSHVYSSDFSKSAIAKAAPLVQEVCEKGDKIAVLIEKEAAESLVLIASALIRTAKLTSGKVVLSGSILTRNKNIRNRFTEKILRSFPQMTVAPVTEKPEIGAAYLAWKEFTL